MTAGGCSRGRGALMGMQRGRMQQGMQALQPSNPALHCRHTNVNKQQTLRRRTKANAKLKSATHTVKRASDTIGELAKVLPQSRVVKIAHVREGSKSTGKGGDNRHFEKKASPPSAWPSRLITYLYDAGTVHASSSKECEWHGCC